MANPKKTSWMACTMPLRLIAVCAVLMISPQIEAQSAASTRQAKSTATPHYPEMARGLNLSATVKVQVTVSPSGKVLDAKPTGGHPLFISPSIEAAKRWQYEPAAQNTVEIIEFHFSPGAS